MRVPALVLAALVVVAVGAWRLWPRAPATVAPPGGKPTLAVFYCENNSGDASLNAWRTNLPELLGTSLSQSRLLNVVSSERMFTILKSLNLADAKRFSIDDLAAVGREGRAQYLLTCSVMIAGQSTVITTKLQAASGEAVSPPHRIEVNDGDVTLQGGRSGCTDQKRPQPVGARARERQRLSARPGSDVLSRGLEGLLSGATIQSQWRLPRRSQGEAFAAKPTGAFREAFAKVWKKVDYDKWTGTFAVVPVDGVTGGNLWGRTRTAIPENEYCRQLELVDGVVREAAPDKYTAERAIDALPRAAVMTVNDVAFKDAGVELTLWGPRVSIRRQEVKSGAVSTDTELYCLVLRISSSRGPLDQGDLPGVLASIEAIAKPFASKQAAEEYAETLAPKGEGAQP